MPVIFAFDDTMDKQALWQRYQDLRVFVESAGLSLDVSRVRFPDDFFDRLAPAANRAFEQMAALERGAIANPDEKRMVGHYWLRDAALAPSADLRTAIERDRARDPGVRRGRARRARSSAGGREVHPRARRSASAAPRSGRSSSPMRSAPARDPMAVHFFDNTDPDGIDRVFAQRRPEELAADARRSSSPSPAAPRRRATACWRSRPPTRRRPRLRQARRRHHRRGQRARQATAEAEGWLRPLPDVGLGRRPHLRAVRGRPAAGGAAGHRHRGIPRRRRGDGRAHPRSWTRARTPPCSWR